ncbi:MAG: hypothetical protein DI630_08850 [Gordonia sp. (in: high G+C Gram-positive bacteria)]|nr:MAG: hypothetical protein DI630_08850 [Gordonia sp. (in: high G+C Gram-positive bacteria)]
MMVVGGAGGGAGIVRVLLAGTEMVGDEMRDSPFDVVTGVVVLVLENLAVTELSSLTVSGLLLPPVITTAMITPTASSSAAPALAETSTHRLLSRLCPTAAAATMAAPLAAAYWGSSTSCTGSCRAYSSDGATPGT